MSKHKTALSTPGLPTPSDVLTGPCCACGRVIKGMRNVICLPFRAPVQDGEQRIEGESRIGGWGCAVCHLPAEGAVAFVCDLCLDQDVPLKSFVLGDPRDGRRGRVEDLTWGPWGHDLEQHPEERQ